jgi:hypothetical protein
MIRSLRSCTSIVQAQAWGCKSEQVTPANRSESCHFLIEVDQWPSIWFLGTDGKLLSQHSTWVRKTRLAKQKKSSIWRVLNFAAWCCKHVKKTPILRRDIIPARVEQPINIYWLWSQDYYQCCRSHPEAVTQAVAPWIWLVLKAYGWLRERKRDAKSPAPLRRSLEPLIQSS